MLSAIGFGFVAAGATLVAFGGICWGRQLARRRPWADVLDMIEPPRVVMPLRCVCTARLPFCSCAVDGGRNPRGAGRARTAPHPAEVVIAKSQSVGKSTDVVAAIAARFKFCPVCFADACETPTVCRAVTRLYS